jgi:hypothetical protein
VRISRISALEELLPSFREALVGLLLSLRRDGYAPLVHETYRTPERAALLIEQGRSRIRPGQASMHTLRIAADVLCGVHLWDCPSSCDFYARLGSRAGLRGMTWGGRFRARDLVHVQGVPVAVQRAARLASSEELDAMVREYVR